MTHQSGKADVLAELRAAGLAVAVHNDYRLNGKAHTFWLFTGPDGRAYKGEGRTDAEALEQVTASWNRRPTAPSGDGLTDEEIREIAGKGAAVLANMHNSDPDFKRSWVALRAVEGARQLRGAMPILTAAGYEIRRPSPAHGEGALREALEEYEAQVDAAGGCGDGGCLVKRPVGQHTNGGCLCWSDRMKAQRMMRAGQTLARRARSALAFSSPECPGGMVETREREALIDAQHALSLALSFIPAGTDTTVSRALTDAERKVRFALSAAPPAQTGLTIQYKTDEDNG